MIDPILKKRLQPVARRARSLQLSVKLAVCWAAAACLGLGVLVSQRSGSWNSSLTLPVLAFLGLAAAMLVAVRHCRMAPDWRSLARRIEARHPELDGRLLTAVQQDAGADGELSYLQARVLDEAIQHSRRHKWTALVSGSRRALAQGLHLLAFGLFVFVLSQLRMSSGQVGLLAVRPGILSRGVTVTPGDTSLERGSSLVVLARFGGALPANVELVAGQTPKTSQRIPLVKSLADPVFGGSVPEVTNNFLYHVEYAGRRTRDFKVTVFEHPRLERADVDLHYPAYTGQSPRHVENTRRLSAVEGSRLDLTLQLNKPVASARLVSKDKEKSVVPLFAETNRAVAALKAFPLAASKTYELQLVDADGRTNKVPAQFVFEVFKNRAPELKIASPRGDTRPSALEEMSFEGTVWDDFGVKAFGLAYTLVGQEPKFIELGRDVPPREKRPFQHLLRLEDLGAQPDQLISWFVWADDVGPDDQPRRITGDLFFAEVRPFEEIFRERQGGESQGEQSGEESGQQGNRTGKLAELEKQIISATWKLQSRDRGSAARPSRPDSDNESSSEKRPARGSQSSASPGGRFAVGVMGAVSSEFSVSSQSPQLMGQRSSQQRAPAPPSRSATPEQSANTNQAPQSYEDDATVVHDSQAQALDQAKEARDNQEDPRMAAQWAAAIQEMEKATANLKQAVSSPAALGQALAAEQAAYQALLKLQEREYAVQRSRNQRGSSSREQQMQRQLDQMDLTQSEDRYETQREAQAPPTEERREQLQVLNRLAELARRQQDVNDRLKELQTALQEARTDQEREEIRRRLKRLQEDEQQLLADADELRQRMDRPENQSRMAEQRRQLDQTREEMQRAAQAAEQGSASRALASGTRAQRQMQQMRDDMRKESSSQFSEDLRQMRAEARDLDRRQEALQKQIDSLTDKKSKSLADSDRQQELLDQLTQQKSRLTNLVEHATQVSQQTEEAEPLVSRELYDTLRKFSQQDANSVKDFQEQLLKRGLMSRDLYERLKRVGESDAARVLEITSEMLRQDYIPQASEAGERARASITDLKRGVERAAEKILGDDTEALRLARQQLEQLTDQLEREILQAQGGGTNAQQRVGGAQPGTRTNEVRTARAGQPGASNETRPGNQQAPAEDQQAQSGQQTEPGRQGRQQAQNQQGSPSERSRETAAGGQPGQPRDLAAGRDDITQRDLARRGDNLRDNRLNTSRRGTDELLRGGRYRTGVDDFLDWRGGYWGGPILGEDFAPWSDGLREVEEMVDSPELRNQIALARERARLLRQDFRHDVKKPDWAVVRLQVVTPLVEVRNQIDEELARREPQDKLVPIDRDPVPSRYSELVRRYYEELGKDK